MKGKVVNARMLTKRIIEAIHKTLSAGKHKIIDVFPLCTVKHIKMDDKDRLININTMAEYEEYQKKASLNY